MKTLRVAGVPEHFNLPWHVARESSAFRDVGIDLQWITVPEGTGRMCQMLRDGSTDMAILVTEGAVRDIMRGNPSRIVASYVDSPLTWGVHVGAGSALRKPEQLKRVPFAISRFNSGSHLVAMAYAKQQRWHPKGSDFVVVNDIEGAVDALSKEEPLVFLWEKATTAPWVKNGMMRRLDEHRNPWPCFMVVATNEVLAKTPEAVQKALQVVQHQAKRLKERDDAVPFITQRQGLSMERVEEWFSEISWSENGHIDPHALSQVSIMLSDVGMVDRGLSPEEVSSSLCAGLVER